MRKTDEGNWFYFLPVVVYFKGDKDIEMELLHFVATEDFE